MGKQDTVFYIVLTFETILKKNLGMEKNLYSEIQTGMNGSGKELT